VILAEINAIAGTGSWTPISYARAICVHNHVAFGVDFELEGTHLLESRGFRYVRCMSWNLICSIYRVVAFSLAIEDVCLKRVHIFSVVYGRHFGLLPNCHC